MHTINTNSICDRKEMFLKTFIFKARMKWYKNDVSINFIYLTSRQAKSKNQTLRKLNRDIRQHHFCIE